MNRRQSLKYIFGIGITPFVIANPLFSEGRKTLSPSFIIGFDNSTILDYQSELFLSQLRLLKDFDLKYINIPLNWSALLPDGVGKPNVKETARINMLIDQCLSNNILPWISLNHGVLPEFVKQSGGWLNRVVTDYFNEYTEYCVRNFGDRVNQWSIINCPSESVMLPYMLGQWGKGIGPYKDLLKTCHHINMCQVEAGIIIKDYSKDIKVGTVQSLANVSPASTSYRDQKATKRADIFLNRMFIEPVSKMNYPVDDFLLLSYIKKYFKQGDEQKLNFTFDFTGINFKYNFSVSSSLSPAIIYTSLNEVPINTRGNYFESAGQVLERCWNLPNNKNIVFIDSFKNVEPHLAGDEFNKRLDFIKSIQDSGISLKAYLLG